MRQLCFAMVLFMPLCFVACDGEDEEEDSGTGGSAASGSGGSGTGAGGTSSGSGGLSTELEFSDLPGKIRFANFVSDGEQGMNLDLYWGISIQDSEKVGTIEYQEVTEFLVPRRIDFALLDEDQARYFIVPEGEVDGNPANFLVQHDVTFSAETVTTVALAAAYNVTAAGSFGVSRTSISDDKVTAPPAGMAHVWRWSEPYNEIDDGDFVSIGAALLCDPEDAEAPSINAGVAVLIPEGTSGLTLFDVNTEPPCATGAVPTEETVEAGGNYLLIGEAVTHDREARRTVLLKLGAEE